MAGDPSALALRRTAPDAVIDVIGHGVFETGLFHRAICADPPRHFHTYAITGKEHVGRYLPALPPCHPRSVHHTIVTCSAPLGDAIAHIRSKP